MLADESDFANSNNFFWFADVESRRHADRVVRNQFMLDYIKTEKRSSYGYAFDSEQYVLENKLSVSEAIGFLDTALTYGVSGRYTEAWQLQDFWDEPFSRRDISTGSISGNSVIFPGGPAAPNGANYWNGGFGGQGGNVESRLMQFSAFGYSDSKLTEKLSLTSSALLAYAPFKVGYPTDWAPGTSAAARAAANDEHDKAYYSLSFGPRFKVTEQLTAYATAQRGTAVDPLQGGPIVGRASFAENELLEAGLKSSLMENKLFLSLAAYNWRQSAFNVRDAVSEELEGKGVEFEATYAPTKNFTVIGSINHQVVTLENNAGFRAAGLSEQDWALNGGILPNNFSGVGTSNGGTPGNNPDREYPGTPQVQAKLFGVYSFDNGFGLSAGGVWSESYWHNYDRTIKLPSTFVVNASVFYKRPTWDLTVSLENATNEDYFSGADPIFGAGTIITKAPEANFKVAYTYKF